MLFVVLEVFKNHRYLSIKIFFFIFFIGGLRLDKDHLSAVLLNVRIDEYRISDQIVSIISAIDKSPIYNKRPHR